MALIQQPVLDSAKVDAFVGKAPGDWGTLTSATLIVIGDKLHLYDSLANDGPATPAELSVPHGHRAGVHPSLAYKPGGWRLSGVRREDRPLLTAARARGRVGDAGRRVPDVHQHYEGRTAYHRVLPLWSGHALGRARPWSLFRLRTLLPPSLRAAPGPGLDSGAGRRRGKLQRGGLVADVGCGHGASTVVLARAYPNSSFIGFDSHAASINRARELAAESGVSDRLAFEVATATDFRAPVSGYDLVAFFNCLHDLGKPIDALHRAAQTLAPGGSVLLVEPMAGDTDEENLNPVGRVFLRYIGAGLLAACDR